MKLNKKSNVHLAHNGTIQRLSTAVLRECSERAHQMATIIEMRDVSSECSEHRRISNLRVHLLSSKTLGCENAGRDMIKILP